MSKAGRSLEIYFVIESELTPIRFAGTFAAGTAFAAGTTGGAATAGTTTTLASREGRHSSQSADSAAHCCCLVLRGFRHSGVLLMFSSRRLLRYWHLETTSDKIYGPGLSVKCETCMLGGSELGSPI